MYQTWNMSASGPQSVFVHCTIRSTKTTVLTNRMYSVMFVMTNLKHPLPVNTTFHCHHWPAISWTQSPVLVIWKMFMFSPNLRVWMVMGIFKVIRILDNWNTMPLLLFLYVEINCMLVCVSTLIGGNYICNCIFRLFVTSLSLLCPGNERSELFRHIGTDLPH